MKRSIKNAGIIEWIKYIPEIPAIIMEWAKYGSIQSLLFKQKSPIGWILRMKWSMQISKALSFLHFKGLIHSNLMIESFNIEKET